ncbi:MAG: PaaI family thioesterase [Chloroflexi bacterium]|jgi:uncharacterized protein (TIGR00369 family)|nr:PaaI family thioesterase [Chloroflexota bacterium]
MPLKQPNSRCCFVCGVENPVGLKLKIYEVEEGQVEAWYTPPEHFQGYPGLLHGGIVASLLDELSGRAWMGSDPRNPRFMYTAKLEVKYRKNVPVGQPLRVVGKAIRSKGRIAEGWAGIYNQQGELLAEATALLVDVPAERLDFSRLEELGWKVYED